MGQYYKAVNLDKKQYIHPHVFGDGAKLLEFACRSCGMMTGLAVLLADGNGRGGGDIRSLNPLVGSWAGDRVVITGDYADDGKWAEPGVNLYSHAAETYEDISEKVILAMLDDSGIHDSWVRNADDWHRDMLKRDAPLVLERLAMQS